MASIELKSIFKACGDMAPVIRDVNLHIAQGEFCVFVGPPGCGKSTRTGWHCCNTPLAARSPATTAWHSVLR